MFKQTATSAASGVHDAVRDGADQVRRHMLLDGSHIIVYNIV